MTTPEPPLMQPPTLRKEHLKRLACPSATDLATCSTPEQSSGSHHSPLSSDGPSSASVLDFGSAALKSAKRKAREDLLLSRFSKVNSASSLPQLAVTHAAGGDAASERQAGKRNKPEPGSRPPVVVPACDSACSRPWCSCAVSIPAVDWAAALQPVTASSSIPACGTIQLPGGVEVRLVSRPEQLPAALHALRGSMQDSCIAIDLEWRPDGYMGRAGAGSNKVALMQLASASLCVLVRCCRMPRLPTVLAEFLCDPTLTIVGYSWDGADQAKLTSTYGFGRERFADFHDLQQVSERLGYHGYGLGALTQQVLGFELPKSRKVTMSNWEAWALSPQQIQYAALDALTTGHVFRALRRWHASPSACTSCRQALGTELPKPNWGCLTCQRSFDSLSAAASHVRCKQHEASWCRCRECGRTVAAAEQGHLSP
ncbi:hypothetical protein N2152v2_006807 [Parachlorella kessleri]